MPKEALTDSFIRAIRPPDRGRTEYFDAKVRGLALRVSAPSKRSPEGVRCWYLVYRLPNSASVRRMKLGFYGRGGLSLADARTKAEAARGKVSKEQDPLEARRALRQAGTVGDLCARYLEEYSKPRKRSVEWDAWAINRHIAPIKHLKAAAVTVDDCRDLVLKIRETAPVLSNRIHALLRSIFNWGVSAGALPASIQNPAKGITTAKERPRQKVLTESEIVALWRALQDETTVHRALFRLRFLTLCRGQEIGAMRGQDLRDELKGAVWQIPRDVLKADREMIVPLSRQAVEALCDLTGKPGLADISRDIPGQLFPATAVSAKGVHKAAKRLRTATGIEFRPHDIRRTSATVLGALGVPRLIISHVLGHAESGITGTVYELYDRIDERRAALQQLADHYDRVLSRHGQPGAIIPISSARG